ncbi:MAG: tetratricopeptide repeat protein, partial [Candidatus Latescibacteria bacterium]|nr:tetratricopeptide repeat protein [Candidatus Latescibacterota bacterium]NIO78745.1 tetratricopeptide repeat protein [Candidatus Latescibacterota bacterium]
LEKARSWDPQDEEVMTVLMNAYIAVNRIEEAREQFRQGAELQPQNQYYQYNYGVLLLKDSRYAEAIELF